MPGQDTSALRGTKLRMYGGTFGGPIKRGKIFSFTSFEQWDDKRPNTIVRTVPTEPERRGDFSQSVLNGRVRNIYDPFASTLDAAGRVVRPTFANNVIPQSRLDPVALRMLEQIPLPNVSGNVDNWQGTVFDRVDYWNLSQRVDVNISDKWKIFARYGQFKANLYQENPTDGGFFPLTGSNRYGLSIAGDSVWIMSDRTTLNVRGSFYNMTDEFYNPALLLGADGLRGYWSREWYSSLYNSGYVYYPALDVTTGTGTATTNRLGRQGREWFQHPDAWTASVRMNRYQGRHNMKWGGEVRAYYGEAARFEPINLVFNSTLTANSSDTPDVVNTGNQWASFMLGALDNQTSARLVPLQTPYLRGYAAYYQDDFDLSDRLTLNLGLRWEWEPGPTDADNRLSQRLDLTQPIPEMQATPPAIPDQARQLMASKGYSYLYNGAWVFTTRRQPQRVAQQGVELPAALRRELSPRIRLRRARRLRALHDADQQRARHARRLRQPVHGLRADDDHAGAGQRRAAAGAQRSVPRERQPGDRALRTGVRPLHRSRRRREPRPVRAAAADQRPLQRVLPEGNLGRPDSRRELLLQLRLARAVRHQPEHGGPDVPLRAEGAAQHAGRQPVPELPDARQVPGSGAQHDDGQPRQPAGAVSAVRHDHADQHQRAPPQGAHDRPARAAAVHARRQLPDGVRLRQREAAGVLRRHRRSTKCCRPAAARAGSGGRWPRTTRSAPTRATA